MYSNATYSIVDLIQPDYNAGIAYLVSAPVTSQSEYIPFGLEHKIKYEQEKYSTHIEKTRPTYSHSLMPFLRPGSMHPFVGHAREIESYVRETFNAMGMVFPLDIRVILCSKEKLRKIAPAEGVIGCSINREGLIKEIFVMEGALDQVMVTVGHEIGHVLSKRIGNTTDEEAKAFAFTRMWIAAIQEHNIAGLGISLRMDNPAQNGVHDLADSFVNRMIKSGRSARSVYLDLCNGDLHVNSL